MNYNTINTTIENNILKVTLNRPKQLNALNKQVFEDLEQIMKDVVKNDNVRLIIITGSGDKAFAAGADIKEFADFGVAEGKELSGNGHKIFKMIEESTKPVLAAINGFALGGGLELAMACHLRVASDNAKFGQPEVSLGVTPGYGGTQRLTQLIGKGKSMELLMTGKLIDAATAEKYGLVNQVVAPEKLTEATQKLAEKIMKQSPVAIAGVINCVNAFYEKQENGFLAEVDEFGKCFGTEDFKEGTTAFMNKRKPNFPGK
ncbi:MAG: enoyl-CoA hydratase-related protein [Bacteroidota bacterium]|nr:enoyl-CoA hydratase-related protein [Bacteroidota bacterium]